MGSCSSIPPKKKVMDSRVGSAALPWFFLVCVNHSSLTMYVSATIYLPELEQDVEIEEAMQKLQEAAKAEHKVLVLGGGESGKSTILKQLKLVFKVSTFWEWLTKSRKTEKQEKSLMPRCGLKRAGWVHGAGINYFQAQLTSKCPWLNAGITCKSFNPSLFLNFIALPVLS